MDLPPAMRHGITLHRRIDAFTDSHPAWQASTRRLSPEHRRLGGIIVDVIYDHYLCRHWAEFSDRPLEEFAAYCYDCLLSRTPFMEPEVRRIVRRMQGSDWLSSYQTRDGIAVAFQRMARRGKVLVGIETATRDFVAGYEEFERDFLRFYPELVAFSKASWGEIAG